MIIIRERCVFREGTEPQNESERVIEVKGEEQEEVTKQFQSVVNQLDSKKEGG